MATVIVPDHQLSLAIGKEGQNARLAARLTGYKVDIKSESQDLGLDVEAEDVAGEGDAAATAEGAAVDEVEATEETPDAAPAIEVSDEVAAGDVEETVAAAEEAPDEEAPDEEAAAEVAVDAGTVEGAPPADEAAAQAEAETS